MQIATSANARSHLRLMPQPIDTLQLASVDICDRADAPIRVQYSIDRMTCPNSGCSEVHAYHIRQEGALTRAALLSTVRTVGKQNRGHYDDVINRVTNEPGCWPIANSAYIVFHVGTDPFSTLNEGKQLKKLMHLIKNHYGKTDQLLVMSVILRELGDIDVSTI